MNRRTLLAAVAAGTTGTVGGARWLADDAAATTIGLQVDGDETTVTDADAIDAVRLDIDTEWSYELAETASPDTVTVEIAAGREGELTTVADAESAQLFTEADGAESFEVDLLATDALDADALVPDEGTRTTTVVVEATMEVTDGGDVLASESVRTEATITVTVPDVPDAEISGDGELTIETA